MAKRKKDEAEKAGEGTRKKAKKAVVPIGERRGISKKLEESYHAMVVEARGVGDADALLDLMLKEGWIGGVKREVGKELLAGRVARPMGAWGLVVQLVGQPWMYLVGDGLRYEWVRELARKMGRRAALFELSGLHGTLYARAYEGEEVLFEFECGGFVSAGEGREVVKVKEEAFDMAIGGKWFEAGWLKQFKSGPAAQEALARELGVYVPVLWHEGREGKAGVYGRDSTVFKKGDYARIDLVVFGAASTLEPTEAAFELAKAVRAGDAEGVRAAVARGADVRYLPDEDESPLHAALALGQGGTYDWRYKRSSREQQVEVMKALLEAGARPEVEGENPAIHWVIHWGDKGDERTVVRQLRLLLDHGADPNALGTFLRGAGQRPLHVVAVHHQWMAVLKLLVSRGADAKRKNRAGKTPREAAEGMLAYRRESAAQRAEQMAKFGAWVPKGKGKGMAAAAGLLGAVLREEAAEKSAEEKRLEEVIAFLAAAERGEADVSGIDEIAEASWKAWSAEHERWKAERKAADPALWRELHGEGY